MRKEEDIEKTKPIILNEKLFQNLDRELLEIFQEHYQKKEKKGEKKTLNFIKVLANKINF